jgi:hypothetical protein
MVDIDAGVSHILIAGKTEKLICGWVDRDYFPLISPVNEVG